MPAVWTTPQTWLPVLVTEDDMNREVRDNLLFLFDSFNSLDRVRVLARDVTTQNVVNTTTETTVFTFTVPGGTLGSSSGVRFHLIGDFFNNSGGSQTWTIRVKYGSSTIFIATNTYSAGANRAALFIDAILIAANAANAQYGSCKMQVDGSVANNAAGTLVADTSVASVQYRGVNNNIAVDSATDQAFVVTFQFGAADANLSMRAHAAFLELL